MSHCDCHIEIESQEQRRVLILLLLINAVMFVVEITFGIIGESTGLISDAVDMLADALVYGAGLYAVGKAKVMKIRAAHMSGIFQIILALGVLADVTRRFLFGSEPESMFMLGFGMLALLANIWCLSLISAHRHGEIHMRASWIFSKNDVIANVGVILGGALVFLLDSHLPDLLVGCAIAIIVIRGGIAIIKDAAKEKSQMVEL